MIMGNSAGNEIFLLINFFMKIIKKLLRTSLNASLIIKSIYERKCRIKKIQGLILLYLDFLIL